MVDVKKCNQCGHIWVPRTDEEPRACPKCKRYDWKKKKVEKNERLDM